MTKQHHVNIWIINDNIYFPTVTLHVHWKIHLSEVCSQQRQNVIRDTPL
jgi:hypothetical protein